MSQTTASRLLAKGNRKKLRFSQYDDLVMFSDIGDPDAIPVPEDPPSPFSPASEGTWGTSTPLSSEAMDLAETRKSSSSKDPRSYEMISSLKIPWNVRFPRPQGPWDKCPASKDPSIGRIVISLQELGVLFVDRPSEDEPITVGDIYEVIRERLHSPISRDTPQYEALDDERRLLVEESFQKDGGMITEGHCGDYLDLLMGNCVLTDIVPYKGSGSWKIVFSQLTKFSPD